MKNMNILEFHAKINKHPEHSRIPRVNHANHENFRNPYEDNAKFNRIINKIIKISKCHARITKQMKIMTSRRES